MPRIVDDAQRRDEIGGAALAIAMSEGIEAVTFRAVAAQMGASSTTAVTHYAPSRAAVLEIMLGRLYSQARATIEDTGWPDDPREALAKLADSVLPTDPLTMTGARIIFAASMQITGDLGSQVDFARWGDWLRERVSALVTEILGSGSTDVSDAVMATITGLSFLALMDPDHWSPDRQRTAMAATLDAHQLSPRSS